ncbi:hypothetical protein [Salinibacterium sp. ZJ70]|uniref:hypothetical protein n=1 Tax=Salinibacterium sp. ZJ70 TaxID=2708084 RepID=UPI001420513B|nr:hypothetical protein [Salinibacterium sp. ZJ70]
MRRLPRPILIPALITGLALTSCAPSLPLASTATISTHEDAERAARDSYDAFIQAYDALHLDEVPDISALRATTTATLSQVAEDSRRGLDADGIRAVGRTTFELEVVDFDAKTITARVCENRVEHDLLDSSGVSIMLPGSPMWVSLGVVFDVHETVIVTERNQLPREEACGARPLFASETAAKDAAVAAYDDYLDALLAMYASGGYETEHLTSFTTTRFYEWSIPSYLSLRSGNMRLTEGSTIEHALAPEEAIISEHHLMVMMCVDYRNLFFTDDTSTQVQYSDRMELIAVDVLFHQNDFRLIVEGEALRDDLDLCNG